MMRLFILLLAILALSSCQRVRKGYDIMKNDVELAVYGLDSKNAIAGTKDTFLDYPETTPGEHHLTEHSYCYKVLTDIMCYTEPKPGKEHLLVGYQVPEYVYSNNNSYSVSVPVQKIQTQAIQSDATPTGVLTSDPLDMEDAPRDLLGGQ